MNKLTKYSFGVGDRFGRQGGAQMAAIRKALEQGVLVTPVWNKSNREHQIIGSSPEETRREADRAVRDANWDHPYFVDADHIGLVTVDRYLGCSDFFTIDVADSIGINPPASEIDRFADENKGLAGVLRFEASGEPVEINETDLRETASVYWRAVSEVERVYRHILDHKDRDEVVIEVSMDEVEEPQTPEELLLILKMLADKDIRLDTIAVKFSGRFNKGVDYDGDLDRFTHEFERDLMVIDHAVREFGMPGNLKLSMHSGSDKFSLYRPIRTLLNRHDKGIHVKTAGTTWLEELIGLSLAGDEAAGLVKKIYRRGLERREEMTARYKTVTDIDGSKLPGPGEVERWSGGKLADALRHNPGHPDFNPHMRQLMHCSYKIAAELGDEFTDALERHEDIISANVTENLYERHIKPLFLDG